LIKLVLLAALSAAPLFTAGPVETVAEGFVFTEGPLWWKGTLYFSDIPADTIYTPDKQVFRKPSGQSNGLTLDREGRLLAAEHQGRRVSRTEADGTITVIADRFEGKRLNSPNDVIVRKDGMVFFTDPPYGLAGGLEGDEAELDFAGVFAVMPGSPAIALARDFKKPNGLALSMDEKTLYVADSEVGHLRAFDVAADGTLSNGRVFCEMPGPDGIKVDLEGKIWATGGDGVRLIDSKGALLQTLEMPMKPTNCGFGGADGKTLYVTARKTVHKVALAVAGPLPGAP
jgi:gluconolactonase